MSLQTSPGQYDNNLLVALDNVIASAGTQGLKLILALANNWNYNSGLASDTKCACNHSQLPLTQHAALCASSSSLLLASAR